LILEDISNFQWISTKLFICGLLYFYFAGLSDCLHHSQLNIRAPFEFPYLANQFCLVSFVMFTEIFQLVDFCVRVRTMGVSVKHKKTNFRHCDNLCSTKRSFKTSKTVVLMTNFISETICRLLHSWQILKRCQIFLRSKNSCWCNQNHYSRLLLKYGLFFILDTIDQHGNLLL
jgi:hypothetical protein